MAQTRLAPRSGSRLPIALHRIPASVGPVSPPESVGTRGCHQRPGTHRPRNDPLFGEKTR